MAKGKIFSCSPPADQTTYDTIQHIPLASKIGVHARQQLIRRLEGYQLQSPQEFSRAVQFIEQRFVPEIRRHAIAGLAAVRIPQTDLASSPQLLDMIMDILSERGYQVHVDTQSYEVPRRTAVGTWTFICETVVTHKFLVRFKEHHLRAVAANQLDELNPRLLANDVASTELPVSTSQQPASSSR